MLLKGTKNLPFPFLFLLVLPEEQDMQMWMVYSLIYTELSASEEIKEVFCSLHNNIKIYYPMFSISIQMQRETRSFHASQMFNYRALLKCYHSSLKGICSFIEIVFRSFIELSQVPYSSCL
jgi:hypothetical protein